MNNRTDTSALSAILLSGITMLFLGGSLLGCSGKSGGPQERTVAGIVFQEDQFFRLVLFGMREAAAKHGVNLLEANSAGKPDKEIQLVNTYIASGVDAIVISPLSAKASLSALERVQEKGIVVVTYNTTVEGNLPTAYIESDQYDLGASTGKAARSYVERVTGGKARVAILAFQSQAPETSRLRVNGFKEQMQQLPGVTIVAEQDAWLAEQAVKKVGDVLTANPDLTIVWAANEGGTVGAVMAVRNAGKAGKVAVFGTDASEQLADFILAEDNVLQAVTGQRPFDIGFKAVEAAVRVLNKETVDAKVSLPGILLSRENPGAVRNFKDRLIEFSR